MTRDFQSDDEGKKVMTADGDMVGTIETVSGSTAHVKPDQNLSRGTRRRLGWSEDDDVVELPHSEVESISHDEVRLKKN